MHCMWHYIIIVQQSQSDSNKAPLQNHCYNVWYVDKFLAYDSIKLLDSPFLLLSQTRRTEIGLLVASTSVIAVAVIIGKDDSR